MFRRKYYRRQEEIEMEIPNVSEIQFFPETHSISVTREPPKGGDGFPKIMYQNYILQVVFDKGVVEYTEARNYGGEIFIYYKLHEPTSCYYKSGGTQTRSVVFTNSKNWKFK